MATTAAAQTANALPMFYESAVPLHSSVHAKKHLVEAPTFGYARNANIVPLMIGEFAAAAMHYPIVFANPDQPVPVAVLGMRAGQNLFVDSAGQWLAETYIPAYVRRYPFILARNESSDDLTLCVDERSPLISESTGQPLFAAEKPTDTTNRMLQFCLDYEQQARATSQFSAAVVLSNLLLDRSLAVPHPAGSTIQLDGFKTLEESRMADISDETFLDWRRRGWLAPLWLHLASMQNWRRLARLTPMT